MTWQYCPECDGGLIEPSLREILTNEFICPHCSNDVAHDVLWDEHYQGAIIILLERVEELERLVNSLANSHKLIG
jgi:hypothetical protein